MLAAGPAAASVNDMTSWRAYVHGRAAISQDQLDEAANQFNIALEASGGDRMLKKRTFGLALLSGNEKLSYELARQLEAAGEKGFDTRLVLLGRAIQKKKWSEARAIRNALSDENQLLFTLPVIDAWLAFGSGQKDALTPIGTIGRDVLANSYAAEHRAFLLGALGKTDEALVEYQPLIGGDSGRAVRMRLAAAAMLQDAGQKANAVAILAGDSPSLAVGRLHVSEGKRLPTAIDTPAAGVSELFTRLASDVSKEQSSQIGLALGRLATFLAPLNAEAWLVTANMLAGDDKPQAALVALSHISPTDPFAVQATSLRIALLQGLGRHAEALGIAQAASTSPGAGAAEWTQLGDVLAEAESHQSAALAYGKALALTSDKDRQWQLYLMRGGAYERANDWKHAEPDLRKALELAPDQPVALNYLGYALLDRNLKLDEAQRLIEKASALRPQDGAITDSLAWAYFRRGNYQRAIELLERAVRSVPAEPTINEHLGDAYWHVGRKYEARYSWRAALVGAEDEPVLERLRRKIDFGMEAGGGFNP